MNLLLIVTATKDEPENENDDNNIHGGASRCDRKMAYNGYSEEFLDRLEPNGNIPRNYNMIYGNNLLYYLISQSCSVRTVSAVYMNL